MIKHQPNDLKQMQLLPLEAKIRMTKDRIKVWYESWKKYEIYDTKTMKTRFETLSSEPEDLFYIKIPGKKKPKKILVNLDQIRTNGYEILDKKPYLKDSEYVQSVQDGQVYVSFSGGKDSTVLKHIIDSMYDDVPALFVNTGLEYPEIQKHVKSIKEGKYDCFNSDVVIVRPEMRFDEVIKNHGYPVLSKETAHYIFYGRKAEDIGDTLQVEKYVDGLKINRKTGEKYYFKPMSKTAKKLFKERTIPVSDACCLIMKKTPAKKYAKQTGRKPIIGTMACESKLRYQKWVQNGCNAFNLTEPTSTPLSFWTEQDIYHYIKKYNVPICSVYGDIVIDDTGNEEAMEGQITLIDYLECYSQEDKLRTTGCNRTGCIFCMFGCHLEKEPNRFQMLKETHPRQYEYCIGGGEMVDGKWQPNKEGLGLGKVLDYIGVPYE